MLSKKYRLPLTTEFDRIKKQGRMINGPLFGLLISNQQSAIPAKWDPALRDSNQQLSRFGFIISTKVDKKAVIRHRIKRLLSEAVRSNLGKVKPGYDIVFLAKKSIVGRSFEEVRKEVEDRLEKAQLLI